MLYQVRCAGLHQLDLLGFAAVGLKPNLHEAFLDGEKAKFEIGSLRESKRVSFLHEGFLPVLTELREVGGDCRLDSPD